MDIVRHAAQTSTNMTALSCAQSAVEKASAASASTQDTGETMRMGVPSAPLAAPQMAGPAQPCLSTVWSLTMETWA